MKLNYLTVAAASAALMIYAVPAFAADVAPAPAPSKNNTLSIEFYPEWKTSNGAWADDGVKLGLSHTFDNNVVLGSTFAYEWRSDSTSVDKLEGSLGYKIKAGAFTLTPSAYLGYGFGDQPKIDHLDKFADELYYAVTLAGDLKLDDHWTWNMFNARYRNAFSTTWITPKISSGITYKFDSTSSIYANVGYAWKDAGDGKGLQGDKWNVAVGYKLAF